MTKRQTVVAIIVVIAACIVVAIRNPPITTIYPYGQRPGAADLRNAMYLAAAGTAVLAVIIALSPWGRSQVCRVQSGSGNRHC